MNSYSAGLVSHGANVPSYDTKAAALKAAKSCARANPGRLVSYCATIRKPGYPVVDERRTFKANEAGKVVEQPK